MAGQQRLIECIFCGTIEPEGKKGEDIISDWFARAYYGAGDYTLDLATLTSDGVIAEESIRSQTVAKVRLPSVCRACNNGWMSQIENAASPLLRPMMEGESVVLTLDDRTILAKWCQLKAITLDAFFDTRQLDSDFATRAEAHLPFRTLGVVFGKIDAIDERHVLVARRTGTSQVLQVELRAGQELRSVPDEIRDYDVIRFTFAYRHLAFQVIGARLPVERFVYGGAPEWVSIWPPEAFRDHEPTNWPSKPFGTLSDLARRL